MEDGELADIREQYEQVRDRYVAFTKALNVLLTQLMEAEAIPTESVSGRTKDIPSLVDKFRRKPDYTSLDDVVDKTGLRIVTRYQSDIARTCEMLSAEFTVRETVQRGAENIQAFGYASYHMVIELDAGRGKRREWAAFSGLVAEIQVRSILQHAWASISHGLDYKTGPEAPAGVRRRLFRVAALLETGDELFDTFRADVERIKSAYQEDVSRDAWRDLALDYESLIAAWDHLPMAQLVDAAKANGWLESSEPIVEPPANETERLRASRLIAVAPAVGIETVGQLANEMTAVAQSSDRLKQFAEVGGKNGFVPFAIAPDIAVLSFMANDTRGTTHEALADEFKKSIADTARELAGLPPTED